jgi:hypothetical protein
MDPVPSAVPAQEAAFALREHARCTPCAARVWLDRADDVCPGCGGPLETVERLSELVGLRCLRARPSGAYGRRSDRSDRISELIRATVARNDAERR